MQFLARKGRSTMKKFDTVEQALEELKRGKIILVTDDEDRENEGDFICAAEFATTENLNFMATHGKGLICMPMSKENVGSVTLTLTVNFLIFLFCALYTSKDTVYLPVFLA